MLARPAIRLRRWLAVLAVVLTLTVGSAIALLRIRFEGPDLGQTLAETMNAKMRGRIAIGSIEWPMSGLSTMVTGGWVPLTIRDVEVWDSDHQSVLTTPKITAEIDIHALLFGHHDFVFRHIVVHGGSVLLREVPEPYPLHEYDTKVFSLLAAFYAKRSSPASYYAGLASAPAAPLFDLRDFTLHDVDLEMLIKPLPGDEGYQIRARVEDLGAEGFLYMDPSDPLIPKFYFSLAPHGGPGELDLFWAEAKDGSGWHGAYRFPIDALRVDRLSQLPASWPQSAVANTVRFQLDLDLTSKARAAITGRMIEYWGSPYGGFWDVTLDVADAGKMLHEAFLPELGGDDVTIKTVVKGPMVFYPRVDLAISGLTYDLDLLGRDLHLELETLHAVYDLAVNKGTVEEFIGRGAGGELTLSASFEGDGSNEAPFLVDANIAIDSLHLAPWMTPCMHDLIGSTLSGHLRARRYKGDTALVAQVDDFVFDFGRLRLSAPPSQPDAAAGILADQYQSRLDLADVKAQLGTARAQLDGYYYWKTQRKKIRLKGKAAGLTELANRVTRCVSEVSTLTAPPPASPRRAHRPARRRGSFVGRRQAGAARVAQAAAPARYQAQPRPTQAPAPPRARPRRCRDIDLGDTETEWSSDDGVASTFAGTADVSCLPIVDTAHVQYRTDGVTATIENATSTGLGGQIRASGVVRLKPAVSIERLRVLADNVDLSRIAGLDRLIKGKVFADVTVRGPPDPRRITGEGWLCAPRVSVLGDVYTDLGVWVSRAPGPLARCKTVTPPAGSNDACLAVGKAGGRCVVVHARRDAGGELAMRVHADRNQRLGGTIGVTGLPLSAIAALLGTTIPAGATLDATELAVGGTVEAPTLSGTVRVTRGWLLGSFLGDGDLTLREAGPGAVELTGSFLDGRLLVRGRLATAAPYALDLTLAVTRVTVDSLVDLPRLTGLPAARAAVSGRVRVRTALGDPKAPLDVAIELSELTTTVAVPGLSDTPAPVDVRLTRPMVAHFDGTTVELSAPAAFETPFGTIAVQGKLSAAAVDLSAQGTLDLTRARSLLPPMIDDLRGSAILTARMTGRIDYPRVKATLDVDHAAVRLARQDALLRVPEGRIELDDDTLSFTGLRLEVTDGYSDVAQAALTIRGGIVLEDWVPAVWSVIVEGDLAGEMLVALAPADIASATGVADLTVRLQGERRGWVPPLDAEIVFDPARPLTILPRSARREIALATGTVLVTDQQIEIDEVGGTIDGEGRLRGIRGTVDLRDWQVVGADVTGSADAVPYRVPRTLDLVLNIDRLNGVLDERGQLEVSGNVEIVSGRYLRDFDLGEALKQSTSTAPSAPPFWDAMPMIADARLDLRLEARQFAVADNIANIDMFGMLQLTGTPRDPRIDGTISVQRGQFRIPGLRPRFSRTAGTVTFSPLLPPGQTPTLDITSEADYRDPTGQDHLITLVVKGSLGQPDWDLFTASGLNKAQTLTLIISGRTPEEFRRNLGQGAIGSDPTRINPSTDDSQGYTDELFRQAAGDLLTKAVADTLRELSGLDVARIEFNLGSFGFHGEKRVFENAQLVGDLERTTRGSTVNARAEIRLPWSTTGELSWLVKNFDDAAEKDINDIELKLVLRSFWRRVLGD